MSVKRADAVQSIASGPYERRLEAAETLRRRARRDDAAHIVDVLTAEVAEGVTDDNWEIVYHLVMAVATAGHTPACTLLRHLVERLRLNDQEGVRTALGDAIVRLCRARPGDPTPILWCLARRDDHLLEGAFRAAAMLREVYDENTCARLLDAVRDASGEPIQTFRFWPAAAAAGWKGPAVEEFLRACATSPRDEVRDAAVASLRGRYKSWKPL